MRAGSEEAFAWLITRYHQPIYSLLARTVRNSADAADLTQEVFVKGLPRNSRFFTVILRYARGSTASRYAKRRTSVAGGSGINSGKLPWSRRWRRERAARPVQLKDMLVDPAESPYEMALHEENRARGGN
ncbi:MAG: sigma factor [Terracidiphilus sp.]